MDEKVALIIGNLVLQLARLELENKALKEALAERAPADAQGAA